MALRRVCEGGEGVVSMVRTRQRPRITVDEVVDAFRVTGFIPERRDYVSVIDGRGTALDAIWHARGMSHDDYRRWMNKMGPAYTTGFLQGWKGNKRLRPWPHNNSRHLLKLGFADGHAAWDAVVILSEEGN